MYALDTPQNAKGIINWLYTATLPAPLQPKDLWVRCSPDSEGNCTVCTVPLAVQNDTYTNKSENTDK